MKFSWRWIGDHVDLAGIDPLWVADRFTMTVAELESVHPIGRDLEQVVIGKIKDLDRHPHADHLWVVMVDIGKKVVQVVSGAPNLRKGLFVPLALPGSTIPNKITVDAIELKGVTSEGVLLSEMEMGLSDDHSGVLELDDNLQAGCPFLEVYPIDDFIFEVDNKSITHRPDLWGHHGIAREISALVGRALGKLDDKCPQGDKDFLKVIVDDGHDCPRYMALGFENIKVGKAPFMIRHRLRAVGIRSISNVVDISNYVMLDVGEPIHAFDRRFISKDTIWVRRARDGESLRTLDGVDRVLTTEDLVICDAEKPIALAGVMGGENSEIKDDTTEVVLECATFHPGLVRRTALRHSLRTEASSRFEKSLDPNLPLKAATMFARMISCLIPGAKPSSILYDVKAFDPTPKHIILKPDYVSRRLGTEVPKEKTKQILVSLGFDVKEQGDAFDVTVPSFRATRDISIPIDLVEEVGRIMGYDKCPPKAPLAPVVLVQRLPLKEMIRKTRRVLSLECGLDEVITYSFSSINLEDKINYHPEDPLYVKNPISVDAGRLRTELIPNLLGVMERNAEKINRFGIYEIGRVFSAKKDKEQIPIQPYHLGILLYNREAKAESQTTDLFRQLKGIIGHVSKSLMLPELQFERVVEANKPWIHPLRSAKIHVSTTEIGYISCIHPFVMYSLRLQGSGACLEISLETLKQLPTIPMKYKSISKFPCIEADLSFVIPQRNEVKDIEAIIRKNAGDYLAHLEFVTIYTGDPIPKGYKSVTYRMTFEAHDRTLSDAEVKSYVDKVIKAAKEVGISIRDR